jgi:hypothetical protein
MQRTSEESEKFGRLLGSFVCFEQSTLSGHRHLGHHLDHRHRPSDRRHHRDDHLGH